MNRFDTITALRQHLDSLPTDRPVGLVPTMGALHEGHLTLIETARQAGDLVVASIFVNPVQFNNPDDLARYPRTLEEDCRMLEAAGCDIVFAPSVTEMYPNPPAMRLSFGDLETVMEGAHRPGHFNGVGIVVAKLFNIVQPQRAYFGQKDLQQVAVIRQLIRELSFPVELVRCPTVREPNGLAMSSRNRNLTPEERELAPALHEALTLAHDLLSEGQSTAQAKAAVTGFFSNNPNFRLEYVDIANADTLQPAGEVLAPGQTAICLAVHLGKVRLIDNVVF
ncbi:pantoate--beta-alanine ligase [Spirosoma utsteinense]|uniref:Pantothenate synthetase n=1 Tax=Spirosoma utsteinense TaxID=2585773 RepID=A0ABR6W8U9_9BACT|nr:pantoate--beta-alanine ligase [Spirosoma utsteinense]MBC3786195.1 pantoate--beta-alanine ligase [Spirosoma utsteinense]MBC3792386.1 pantoate--beta-alanine ligase [Spirosoma utsteinense]